MSSLLKPTWQVGDQAWHCDTHGGPSYPHDKQQQRWPKAMRLCEIIEIETADKWGHHTITIRHLDDDTEMSISESWLSIAQCLPPPYFDREEEAA